jgi:hypothetical protein
MLNSKNKSKKLITPEKAATFIPVFISSGISILLITFFVIPKYLKSTEVNSELNGLIQKKNGLNNLKKQYEIINKKFDKLKKEKSKIIELITGTSNLDTLLAELGRLSRKNNIEFLSIVPKKVVFAAENSDNKNLKNKNNQPDLKEDPLLVEGIKKYLIDLTFTTEFVSLLSFLRDLEFLDNAILLNSIDISSNSQNNDNREIDKASNILEINISVTFYGKN